MPHDPPDPTASTSTASTSASSRTEDQDAADAARTSPAASEQIPATLVPEKGWHFLHLFYRVDRARLGTLSLRGSSARPRGFVAGSFGQNRRRSRADPVFRGPGSQGRLRNRHGRARPPGDSRHPDGRPGLEPGPALEPTYSFYSITEVSEYVPDADEYARFSANARASIPTAACSRPRSPRTPSGSDR